MNWVLGVDFIISILTLIMVGVELFINTNQRKIDRKIEVTIAERRRMQQELFKNILGILEIDRECQYKKFLKEENVRLHEVLNYKIGVWINLNRQNSFSENLRSECNQLATCVGSYLDTLGDGKEKYRYMQTANLNRHKIWGLIDKYIEEEERLIQSIVSGEKKKI